MYNHIHIYFQTHKIILITTYPILQTIKNATSKSHLKIRLTSNINQKSINTFLQYLYENYIILTKKNYNEIKKITKLLQINNITKYYTNFNKTINKSTNAQFRYNFQNQTNFKHIKISNLFKKQKKSTKKNNKIHRPLNPNIKKQKIHTSSNPKIHDTNNITKNYNTTTNP